MATEVNWWVVCEEHTIGPYNKGRAERELKEIEALREHKRWAKLACKHEHRLEQMDSPT